MKRQPYRLPQDAKHGFGGALIDRSRPVSFRLNGRTYDAFEGDTVLSALLAAGVDTAGLHFGEAIALDERFGPPVVPAGTREPANALPADRTPVVSGMTLETLGPWPGPFRAAGMLARIGTALGRVSSSLGHRLDDPHAFEGPWLRLPPARTIAADTVVVGGGIAGMSAALAAADIGGRVVLVERRASLGGDAPFFGAGGDEEAPEAVVRRLAERVAATPSITVLLHTDAHELTGLRVKAHQVEVKDGRPQGRVLALDGARIVIATGMEERLPLFAGNRIPGVVGAVTAFNRAQNYGVWRGSRAVFATPHSYTYRLALLAADAGIAVQRVADSRAAPQSRFIDFCKASGITLASSLVPRWVEAVGKRQHALAVAFAVAIEEAGQDTAPLTTDLFVAAGAWQPRLRLWLMAGGRCSYHAGPRWMGPEGTLDAIALAGAAAGYRSSAACMASGARAARLLAGGEPGPAIEDVEAGAIYESRDAPTAIAPWRAGRVAFLDRGATFTPRPPQAGREALVMGPAQLRALSLGDVAAAVELGAIPLHDAGIVAQERCIGGGEILDSGWRPAAGSASDEIPPYLRGRFGPKPQQIVIAARDDRYFEPGCLIHASSEQADPFAAIGVVTGPAPDGGPGALALANRAAVAGAPALFVRDTSGAVPVTIVTGKRPEPQQKAAAAAG